MRILRVVPMLFEELAHRVIAVDEHRRRAAYPAEMTDEARTQATCAVDSRRIVSGKSRALLILSDAAFLVAVVERKRIEVLDQRIVKHGQADRGCVSGAAVVVPCVTRRQ